MKQFFPCIILFLSSVSKLHTMETVVGLIASTVSTLQPYTASVPQIPLELPDIHEKDLSYSGKLMRAFSNNTSNYLTPLKLGITDPAQENDPTYIHNFTQERDRSQQAYNAVWKYANEMQSTADQNIINRCNDRTKKASAVLIEQSEKFKQKKDNEDSLKTYRELLGNNYPALSLWIIRGALMRAQQHEASIISTVNPADKRITLIQEALKQLASLEQTLSLIDAQGPIQFIKQEDNLAYNEKKSVQDAYAYNDNLEEQGDDF